MLLLTFIFIVEDTAVLQVASVHAAAKDLGVHVAVYWEWDLRRDTLPSVLWR